MDVLVLHSEMCGDCQKRFRDERVMWHDLIHDHIVLPLKCTNSRTAQSLNRELLSVAGRLHLHTLCIFICSRGMGHCRQPVGADLVTGPENTCQSHHAQERIVQSKPRHTRTWLSISDY